MYICNVCGHLQEDLEVGKVFGNNILGGSMEEISNFCPKCGRGDLVEATECKICGEWFDNTDLHGICECCLENEETVGTALAIGEYSVEKIDGINGFIADVLSTEQINNILIKWVEENFVDHSKPVKDFLYADKSAYSEYLEDKYGE